ncbi:MAG: cephalosporin hydroxylase family protein [Candidatus Omnitrophica bacterium]|nr:cephalosporin hydroxylase family protein [Candidatus Omnitrophota bacterium]
MNAHSHDKRPGALTDITSEKPTTITEQHIIDWFHQLYYLRRKQTWENTYWLGLPLLKCPLDLWVYQEIIYDIKPDIIIETGTHWGSSALYYAVLCDIINRGQIITIDVDKKERLVKHPRITYLIGPSTSQEIVNAVSEHCCGKKTVLVNLDSDHSKKHVLNEMNIYSKLVTIGSYLIVEDTNVNGHPVEPQWGPGPMEAVEEFMKSNNSFIIDTSKEKFMMTQNPKGYLKRVK